MPCIPRNVDDDFLVITSCRLDPDLCTGIDVAADGRDGTDGASGSSIWGNGIRLVIMAQRDETAWPNKDLLERAAATSLNSARIIARSIALVMRSIEITQAVASACERAGVNRAELLRSNSSWERAGKPDTAGSVDRRSSLPLTSSMLLELAEGFRDLASSAVTPEGRAAFLDLVFRYTALAAGYDEERVGSRMLH